MEKAGGRIVACTFLSFSLIRTMNSSSDEIYYPSSVRMLHTKEQSTALKIPPIHERCLRICSNADRNCSISNKAQIECISDMVINKGCSIKGIIEEAIREEQCEDLVKLLSLASEGIDDLVAWIRHVQGSG